VAFRSLLFLTVAGAVTALTVFPFNAYIKQPMNISINFF